MHYIMYPHNWKDPTLLEYVYRPYIAFHFIGTQAYSDLS